MIYIFTHTYFLPLLGIAISAMIILLMGLLLIFRNMRMMRSTHHTDNKELQDKPIETSIFTISSKDITAIAGDDVITTQLDLARAYIETGRKQLALKILEHVERNGNSIQQQAAAELARGARPDIVTISKPR